MVLDPHPVGPADAAAFVRAVETSFGEVPDDEDIARLTSNFFDPGLAIAVTDAGRIVATAGAHLFDLTLPAGAGQPCPIVTVPGVTAVGVVPTHRRRGLLTKLMAAQLSDYRSRGFPLAILTASETVIYGRFGYGLAQSFQSVAIEASRARFAGSAPVAGAITLLDHDEAAKVLPDVHDRFRRLQPGELNRRSWWWDNHLADRVADRMGGGGRFYAIHESPVGEADGWVSYRIHPDWTDVLPHARVEIYDLIGLDHTAAAELWRFVLELDLVQEVRAYRRPLDDPLRWLLADPRRLRTTAVIDHLWVRIIDVIGALAARGYGVDDRLVLDIVGNDPGSAGRFALDTGATAGACRPAKRWEKTDLVLGLADLGAIYLGGVRPTTLARAGRMHEVRAGALRVADQAFASPTAPFCTIGF